MPKSSRFSLVGYRQIKQVALRMQSRMGRLGLSASQLSRECSRAATDLVPDTPSLLSANRITKILMNCQPRPGTSAATVISHDEMLNLARALKVSIEWLSVQTDNKEPIVWNVLAERERDTHVLSLLEEYESRADESTIWSEYLPCLFTTEDFMVRFHRAHFSEMDTAGVTKDKRELVDFFDRTGHARRTRILRTDRSFVVTGLVYESEIHGIAKGSGIYGSIPMSVRRGTLKHIVNVLKDSALKMNLWILNDKRVRAAAAWRDYETVTVVGGLFSIWNYHSVSIGWSENPEHVSHQHQILNEIRRHVICNEPRDTIGYVRKIIASI